MSLRSRRDQRRDKGFPVNPRRRGETDAGADGAARVGAADPLERSPSRRENHPEHREAKSELKLTVPLVRRPPSGSLDETIPPRGPPHPVGTMAFVFSSEESFSDGFCLGHYLLARVSSRAC